MDGLSLAQEIRKKTLKVPIIFLTAYSDNDKLLKALQLQTTSYLIKPLSFPQLKEALNKALKYLQIQQQYDSNCISITKTVIYCLDTQEYRIDEEVIKLTEYERRLLHFLCLYKNTQLSGFDIFTEVWFDSEQEYKSNLVRTLIKKLRKKLPEGSLKNIYGGYYKLYTN